MAVIYDKDRIINDSDGLTVARALGLKLNKAGKTYQLLCPGHIDRYGKPDRSFGNAWITKHGYYCAACNTAVNTVNMVIEASGLSYKEALEFVAELNGGKEYYIDEEKTKEFSRPASYSENKKETSSKLSDMPKCISWREMKILGFSPLYDNFKYPLASFENNPEWLSEHAVLGTYYNLLVRYNKILSELSDEERDVWKNLTPKAKAKAAINPVRKKLFEQELEIKSLYNSLSTEQKMIWQREYVNGTLQSFITSCHKAAELIKEDRTESVFLSTLHESGWNNEYLVCKQENDSLQALHKQSPEEYLELIIRKCKSSKEKYEKMAQNLSMCTDSFNVSLSYIISDWLKQIDNIQKTHETALIH